MINEKKLIQIFKSFINTVLLPTFRTNQPVYQEWNYFSNMVSQQSIDYKMLDVYIDVLTKSGPQTFYNNNNINNINNNTFKLDFDRSKTNAMTKTQAHKIENEPFNYDSGFQLNKTVGASQRSKITALFPAKSYNNSNTPSSSIQSTPSTPNYISQSKTHRLTSKTSIKGVQQNTSILGDMERIYKTLSQNQLKLQGNSLQMNNGGTSYYKFKDEKGF